MCRNTGAERRRRKGYAKGAKGAKEYRKGLGLVWFGLLWVLCLNAFTLHAPRRHSREGGNPWLLVNQDRIPTPCGYGAMCRNTGAGRRGRKGYAKGAKEYRKGFGLVWFGCRLSRKRRLACFALISPEAKSHLPPARLAHGCPASACRPCAQPLFSQSPSQARCLLPRCVPHRRGKRVA